MKHFDITEWSDSIRGLSSGADQRRMSAHLDTDCKRCSRVVHALERVAAVARADQETPLPDYASRSVRAYYALCQPERRSWLSDVALGITFDNALQPALANSRVGNRPPRQISFGSADYTLDLMIDPADHASGTGVAGYCLRREADPVAGVPVFLISSGQFAGQATTGELGEFHFEADLDDPMELWLFDNNSSPVAVSFSVEQAS